jgi:hypothetical protein
MYRLATDDTLRDGVTSGRAVIGNSAAPLACAGR